MSLDGFVAGGADDVDRVFKWYSMGSGSAEVGGGNRGYSVRDLEGNVWMFGTANPSA